MSLLICLTTQGLGRRAAGLRKFFNHREILDLQASGEGLGRGGDQGHPSRGPGLRQDRTSDAYVPTRYHSGNSLLDRARFARSRGGALPPGSHGHGPGGPRADSPQRPNVQTSKHRTVKARSGFDRVRRQTSLRRSKPDGAAALAPPPAKPAAPSTPQRTPVASAPGSETGGDFRRRRPR